MSLVAGFQRQGAWHVRCCPGAKRSLRACSSARATAGRSLRAPSQLLPNGNKFTAGSSRRYVQGPLPWPMS